MKQECLVCMNMKRCPTFKDCSCKLYICPPCLDKWNEHTFPVKKCPVCRTIYIEYKPLAERLPRYVVVFICVYTIILIIIILHGKKNLDEYE